MGDTLDTVESAQGVSANFVIAIEGCDRLLTTGLAADALTAWAATEWTQAISGVTIQWDTRQSIRPWTATIDPPEIVIGVIDTDGTDHLGKLVFGRAAGTETFLAEDLDCTETSLDLLSTNAFPASGDVFIGPECVAFSSKNDTTDKLTASARGKFSPFKAESETEKRFGRHHPMPSIGDGFAIASKVTTKPRDWKGKWVGVWLHVKRGGVLDTLAEAQCVWAGRITDIRDSENGPTYLHCELATGKIRDTLLLHSQWQARVANGIYLPVGWTFRAYDARNAVGGTANALTVTTGASGANEIEAGTTTLEDLADKLNEWLAAEVAAARLKLDWSYEATSATPNGPRGKFTLSNGSGANGARLDFPALVVEFMGYETTNNLFAGGVSWNGTSALPYPSPNEPQRIQVHQNVNLEDVTGTWFNNRSFLPGEAGAPATGDYAVLQVNEGAMALFEYVSATQVRLIPPNQFFGEISNSDWYADPPLRSLRWSEDGEMRLRQVALISGDLGDLLTKFLASTGTLGYNSATYDVLPAQLGAAIPWEILGDDWLDSLATLPADDASLVVIIEQPTKLLEVIGVDLAARLAGFVWKLGSLRLASWGTPAAGLSSFTLTEADKAEPADVEGANHRTAGNLTDAFLTNHIKLAWSRSLDGGFANYSGMVNLHYKSAIYDIDTAAPRTFQLRNAMSGSTVLTIRNVLAQALHLFAKPMLLVRRTVNFNHWLSLAPGDFGTITDNHVRDPETGERGVTNYPCMIVSCWHDWGGFEFGINGPPPVRSMSGEVELMLLPVDSIVTYNPAADISSYVAGTKVATCAAHAYSESTEAADATRFPVGAKVLVLERDPDDPALAEATSDTVAAQSGNDITLTTGFTPTAGKAYRIISDTYSTASTTQKEAFCYQADDADGLIADTLNAYVYGWASQSWAGTEETLGANHVELYSANQFGDGKPLDVGGERDAARLANALVNYRTAPLMNTMSRSIKQIASGVRGILEVVHVHFGPGDLLAGDRKVRITPWLRRATAGAAEKLYITLCRQPPTGTARVITDLTAPEYLLDGMVSETLEWSVTTDTWARGTAQEISIRAADPQTGVGYFVVEAQANVQSRGILGAVAMEYETP